MGNGGSRCNDSMVDTLVKRNRIVARDVERAFRLVDRGCFLPSTHRNQAYAEIPIKVLSAPGGPLHPGALHLSTTDVYATVIDHLDLRKGQSFLNIGSGTGYLSSITGIILGDHGVNHGIELYQNLNDYAEKCIDEWLASPGASSVGWTRPTFVTCDVYNEKFLESHAGMYDRVYVSFTLLSVRAMSRVLRLLKIGGILIAPTEENLCRYTRVEDGCCQRRILAPMLFSRAVHLPLPDNEIPQEIPILQKVPSLSCLTRQVIRREVRKAAFNEDITRCTSQTIMVRKGGTKRGQLPPPYIRRNVARRRENEPVPEVIPRDLYYPANQNAVAVNRWRRRATDWINTEGFPETVAERSARSSHSSRSSTPFREPRSPTADDVQVSDSSSGSESDGEEDMDREFDDIFDVVNVDEDDDVGLPPNLAVMHRILRGMPLERVRAQNNERLDAGNPADDPLLVEIVMQDRLIPESSTRSCGNLTDEDSSESDLEAEFTNSGQCSPTFTRHGSRLYVSWSSDELLSDEDPNDPPSERADFSDDDLSEPTMSSASSSSQQAGTSSQKRSIPLERDPEDRQKRRRTERRREVSKQEYSAYERENRESNCIKQRPSRDVAIARGAENFQERIGKLPIPINLRTFVRKMKHEVEL